MAPFYRQVAEQLGWIVEDERLEAMNKANAEALAKLDAAVKGQSSFFGSWFLFFTY